MHQPITSAALSILILLIGSALASPASAARPKAEDVKVMTTPDGVEFGVWGGTPGKPAPTLVLLSGNIVDSFVKSNFLKIGETLQPLGYLCVSIDIPNHGKLAEKGKSNLKGWAVRAAAGDDFVGEFNARMSNVLDYLIAEGMTDPKKIAITGTSRGGYLAVRYMAFDKRVACAAAYSPVSDLRVLTEFESAKDLPGVAAMSLEQSVPDLVGRPVFLIIGDRDDRVSTDSLIAFARKLSAAAVAADVPSEVALHVLSEPRGHSTPRSTNEIAASWVYRVLEGKSLPAAGPAPEAAQNFDSEMP